MSARLPQPNRLANGGLIDRNQPVDVLKGVFDDLPRYFIIGSIGPGQALIEGTAFEEIIDNHTTPSAVACFCSACMLPLL